MALAVNFTIMVSLTGIDRYDLHVEADLYQLAIATISA